MDVYRFSTNESKEQDIIDKIVNTDLIKSSNIRPLAKSFKIKYLDELLHATQ